MNKIVYRDCFMAFLKNRSFHAICILSFFLVIFYGDVVFSGRTFLMETAAPGTMSLPKQGPYRYQGVKPKFVASDPGANAWAMEPINHFASQSVKKGDFPLWNPYVGLAGGPLLADGYTGPLEPIQFLFFFIPNRFWPYSIDVQLLIRFLLAGFGCYLFARRQKIDFLGSVSAGILFMFSSHFVAYGNHPQIKTEALLPLVLYGYDRLSDAEDKYAFCISALLIGWAIIAAMPEATFFVLFLGILWYFSKSVFQKLGKENIFAGIKLIFFRYLGATLLGFLISSAYLFPFLEFLSLAKSAHVAMTARVSPYILWNLPNAILFHTERRELTLGFFAVFALIFCIVHVKDWVNHRLIIIFCSLYAIVFTLTIFDFPLTDWIRTLPVFNRIGFIKYPLPSIVFCLAILVGVFVDRARHFSLSNEKLLWSALIMGTIFSTILIWGNPWNSPSPFVLDIKLYQILFVLVASILFALFSLGFLYRHKKISPHTLQISLLVLVFLEPFYWSTRINRPNRFDPYQSPPFVKYLRKEKEPSRIFALNGILYPNISAAYRLTDIRWLNALIPQTTYNFSEEFIESKEAQTLRFTGIRPISYKMFDLLNVKYIVQGKFPTNVSHQYRQVYDDQDVLIYQNDNVSPRAFMVHDVANVLNQNDAFAQLKNPNIDLKKTAIVENLPVDLVNTINQNNHLEADKGTAKLISSGELDVAITTKASGLLVVSDQYYPGWDATVDGKQTPIYTVDGIFRGIFLNAGTHTIKFEYKPLSFLVGGIISIASLLFTTIFTIVIYSRKWKNRHD